MFPNQGLRLHVSAVETCDCHGSVIECVLVFDPWQTQIDFKWFYFWHRKWDKEHDWIFKLFILSNKLEGPPVHF